MTKTNEDLKTLATVSKIDWKNLITGIAAIVAIVTAGWGQFNLQGQQTQLQGQETEQQVSKYASRRSYELLSKRLDEVFFKLGAVESALHLNIRYVPMVEPVPPPKPRPAPPTMTKVKVTAMVDKPQPVMASPTKTPPNKFIHAKLPGFDLIQKQAELKDLANTLDDDDQDLDAPP